LNKKGVKMGRIPKAEKEKAIMGFKSKSGFSFCWI